MLAVGRCWDVPSAVHRAIKLVLVTLYVLAVASIALYCTCLVQTPNGSNMLDPCGYHSKSCIVLPVNYFGADPC